MKIFGTLINLNVLQDRRFFLNSDFMEYYFGVEVLVWLIPYGRRSQIQTYVQHGKQV